MASSGAFAMVLGAVTEIIGRLAKAGLLGWAVAGVFTVILLWRYCNRRGCADPQCQEDSTPWESSEIPSGWRLHPECPHRQEVAICGAPGGLLHQGQGEESESRGHGK